MVVVKRVELDVLRRILSRDSSLFINWGRAERCTLCKDVFKDSKKCRSLIYSKKNAKNTRSEINLSDWMDRTRCYSSVSSFPCNSCQQTKTPQLYRQSCQLRRRFSRVTFVYTRLDPSRNHVETLEVRSHHEKYRGNYYGDFLSSSVIFNQPFWNYLKRDEFSLMNNRHDSHPPLLCPSF